MSREFERTPGAQIAQAAAELSNAYRRGEFATAPLKSSAHRLAYLQVRMPATFAACSHVFSKVSEQRLDFCPASLLDLGAGPGTAAWAAIQHFPSLKECTFIERDVELIRLGQSLAADSSLAEAHWRQTDLRSYTPAPHDLVIFSYALGEIPVTDARRLLTQAWKATQLLVIVEPGTPKAFARLAEARKQLIAEGATIAAPCPHESECPLLAKGDWCHFAERLERTGEHRRIKGGSLGYEDEKFSYLAATRLPIVARSGRIVRHPQIHSGYVQLQVCSPEGLNQQTVTKSQREIYRAARKAKWGDRWPS